MLQVVLSTLVAGVVLLGIVIFFHELGHFLVAKWRGVKVLKFSLGMGPEMAGFTRGDTRYCLAWIPLGGFVQMAGDAPLEDGSMPQGGPEEFLSHPWFGRLLIAVAGPFANLVTAYVVLVLMCLVGIQYPDYPSALGPLPDSTAAWQLGLREGDRITAVSGTPVSTWHEIETVLSGAAKSGPVTMRVERAGQPLTFAIPEADRRPVLQALDVPPLAARVGNVLTGMPAYKAGLQTGDLIVAIDGKPVAYYQQIRPALRGKADREVRFTLQRGTRTFDLTVKPMSEPGTGADKQAAVIGVEPPRGLTWRDRYTLGGALQGGFVMLGRGVVQSVNQLRLTFQRPVYYGEYVGGPVFIAQMSREAAQKGFDYWLGLLAMINLAVMAFNLLPIPLLDGGHITLALLEAVRRRAISAKAYLNFQRVGLVFVGTLFILIITKDVLRPVQRMLTLDRAPRETTTVEPGSH